MNTERFVASNITEAIQKVKDKYGKDALIISSRKVRQKSGAFGLFGKEMVEIVASGDYMPLNNRKQNNNLQASSLNMEGYTKYPNWQPQFDNENIGLASEARISSLKNSDYESENLKDQMYEVKDMLNELNDKVQTDQNNGNELMHMRQAVSELKNIIKSMASQNSSLGDKNWPPNLISLYQQLVINGVEEKFSRRVVEEIQKKVSSANFDDYEYLKLFTARLFIQSTKIGDIFVDSENKSEQKILSLVGATGVGKTTTIAKIAAMIRFKEPNSKVALITLDNFRLGAAEQLKDYAKIIKTPFKKVTTADEMQAAVKKTFRDQKWILIDTPGASQRDIARINETTKILDSLKQIKNLLVLSSTTRDQELNDTTKRLSNKLKLSGTIFTKLDESATYGSILNHMIRFKLPLLFLAAGQNVPEDIELASHERLLDLTLNLSETFENKNIAKQH